jgi:hypothetical protein
MTLFSTKSWLPYLYYIGRCFFGTSHSGLAQLHRVVVSLEQVTLDLPNSTGSLFLWNKSLWTCPTPPGRCFFGKSRSGLAQLHRVVVSLEQVALDLPNSTGVIYSTLFSLGQVNRGQLCPAWSRGLRRQPQPGNQTGKGRVDY